LLTTIGYRDSKIATMRMHLDDIASIVDETIADDDEAGRLLTTIGYALDHMFGLGHMDGAHEPSCRVREHDRASAKGREKSLETRQGKAEVWLTSVRSIWWDKRGRFPKVGRLRPGGMSQKGLAQWILTNYTGVADPDRPRAVVIPNLPTDEESLVTAFKKWEKD
jgi:hypothetical protein